MAENKKMSEAEKQRLAEKRREENEAARRQAELEYAEDYRRKLQRDRKRAEAAARDERAAREAAAREARSREIAERLESDRREAAAREERSRALLNKVIASRDVPARDDSPIAETVNEETVSPAVLDMPIVEEPASEELIDPIRETDSDAEKGAPVKEKPAEPTFGGEKILLNISDDRILLNITENGASIDEMSYEAAGVKIHEISPAEMLEREGTALSVRQNITVSTEDTEEEPEENDDEIIDAVNPEYDDPITTNYPEVAAIKLLGRSIVAKSAFRKYISESKSAIKQFNKRINTYEESILAEKLALDKHAAILIDIIGAVGAIAEIRCDNLRIVAKFGQRRYIPEIKKSLSAEITRYNDKIYEFLSLTGERLTRLSPELVNRICDGTGAEVIPVFTYNEKYIEIGDGDTAAAEVGFTLNIGGSGDSPIPEMIPVKTESTEHIYSITPVAPSVSASELLRGENVTNRASYKDYLKRAKAAERKINKEISKIRSGINKAEERRDSLGKELGKRRAVLDKMLSTMNHGIEVLRGERDRNLEALEKEREKCDEIEKKLDLNRTYIENESKKANIIIGCLSLEREKLLIAFNTLASAKATSSDKIILHAKNALLSEMARYNSFIDECSMYVDIELSPITAALAEQVLSDNADIKIPKVALLKELVESVGEEKRVVGGRGAKRARPAYTLSINSDQDSSRSGKGGRGRRRLGHTPIRTLHGHFFMGGVAPGNIAGGTLSESDIALAAAMSVPMSASSDGGDLAVPVGATALAASTLKGSGRSGSYIEETDNFIVETKIDGSESAALAHDSIIAQKQANKAMKAEKAAYKAKLKAEKDAVRKERLATKAAEAEARQKLLEEKLSAEAEVEAAKAVSAQSETNSVIDDLKNEYAERTAKFEDADIGKEKVSVNTAADVTENDAKTPAAAVSETADEAPISESSPRKVRRKVIDDAGEESFVEEPCPEKLVDDEIGNAVNEPIIYEDLLDNAAPSADNKVNDRNVSGLDDSTDGEPKKKKIKLRQLPPPEKSENTAEELRPIIDDEPVFPGNTINKDYIDEDDFDPKDSTKIPSVAEVDDGNEDLDADMVIKPTKRGIRKYLRYVNRKIRKSERERRRLISEKKKAEGVAGKARILVSILGVQKKIIDRLINAEIRCCEIGSMRVAKRIADSLRGELKRYNKYIKEYEKLTGDRLTEASLETPALILEGEDYQVIPKVKIREFAAPEEGVVYGDGVTENADYAADSSDDVVMTERDLNKKLNESARQISKLHGELEKKSKEKHNMWGIDKTVCTVECFGIQKKIIDTLASDLRAACQVSSVKKIQSLKRDISAEVKQYNRLVNEYKTVSGNSLTHASDSIAKDIIAGNVYTPIPRVGCVYMNDDDDLGGELRAMSRNSYGVEDESYGIGGIAFRTKVTSQANKDLALMTKRADYQISMLESERDMLSYGYGRESGDVKRNKRELAKRISAIREAHKEALKYESNDNRRYYAVVTANPYTMDLKNKRADRTRVAAIRSKIINLLNERDIVNGKLTAIYDGAKGNISFSSNNQMWRKVKNSAALKSKKKQRHLADAIKRLPITESEKNKIYRLLNEKIDAESTLAMLKKRLRKGKLHSEDKLCVRRDIESQKARIKDLDKKIEMHMKQIKSRIDDVQASSSWYVAFLFVLALAIIGTVLYIYYIGPYISSLFA